MRALGATLLIAMSCAAFGCASDPRAHDPFDHGVTTWPTAARGADLAFAGIPDNAYLAEMFTHRTPKIAAYRGSLATEESFVIETIIDDQSFTSSLGRGNYLHAVQSTRLRASHR